MGIALGAVVANTGNKLFDISVMFSSAATRYNVNDLARIKVGVLADGCTGLKSAKSDLVIFIVELS